MCQDLREFVVYLPLLCLIVLCQFLCLLLVHLMYCLCECFEKNMEIFNYMVSSSQKLVLCFTYSLLG